MTCPARVSQITTRLVKPVVYRIDMFRTRLGTECRVVGTESGAEQMLMRYWLDQPQRCVPLCLCCCCCWYYFFLKNNFRIYKIITNLVLFDIRHSLDELANSVRTVNFFARVSFLTQAIIVILTHY